MFFYYEVVDRKRKPLNDGNIMFMIGHFRVWSCINSNITGSKEIKPRTRSLQLYENRNFCKDRYKCYHCGTKNSILTVPVWFAKEQSDLWDYIPISLRISKIHPEHINCKEFVLCDLLLHYVFIFRPNRISNEPLILFMEFHYCMENIVFYFSFLFANVQLVTVAWNEFLIRFW